MCVDGLEETESDPDVDRENVEVTAEHSVEDRAEDGTSAQDKHLSGMRVLSSKTKGRRVLMVDLVYVLVERSPVKSLVGYTKKRKSCDG